MRSVGGVLVDGGIIGQSSFGLIRANGFSLGSIRSRVAKAGLLANLSAEELKPEEEEGLLNVPFLTM